MTDSDEGLYDGDDMQYQINVTSDDERSSDASAHNEVETDNEGAGMVAEPQLNIEGDNRGGNGQLENDTQQQQCTDDRSEAQSALPEMLAKEFASEEEAGICYQEYARTVGFGIRKHNKRRNVKGNITGRTWVCSRQGFRAAKHMQNRCRGREAKAITRTGCRAQFRVIYNEDTRRWACSFLQRVHNHNLTPPQLVHHIRSHRGVTGPDLSAALSLHKVGVKPSQIHEFMVDRSGGYDKVGYNRRDVENRLAAKRHASAMFRLVREEIDKEALLTAEMCDQDIMSTTYRVRRFGSVGKEVKVVINETSKTLSCTCKLLETIGIPCSHSFVVCKAQNMTEIPSSMILSRWSKAAKIKAHTSSDISYNKSHYMTELARIGQIYAACRSLLRFAGSSLAAYNVAITDIHQLTLKLQAMSHTEEPARQPLARRETVVQDPKVVLTKGSVKKTKMGQPQQRKCSRCGQRGHNVRKCKKRGGTGQQLDDCSSHCMEFFCGSNVMGPNATDAADTNHAPQQPTRYLNVLSWQQIGENGRPFSPTSESWFQQFSASTASQSTDPTLNTSAFASVSNCIATSSSTPTNYAHIWNL
ncbi:hypothetical protein CUMW_233440 [Citrus unshiu]|uniref:Uncharacterized protein n=1 Tax=Citrus unshiu TaxID=55188 RepID=A0A2H5QIG1_CITUN|nr:hypothetical protein CUMW_233440 [Citrus unshiu]